jgi:Asp-tRNA(Asn)/Glu-tRNA(Gln) amidotransferase C subunit
MSKRLYVQNTIRGGAGSHVAMRNQSSLTRQAKKSLARFDKNPADEDALEIAIKTLNDISDMLRKRTRKDEDEEVIDNTDSPFADEDETEPDTEANRIVANSMTIRNDAVARELERKNYHQNSGHSREMRLVRNSAGVSFLDDEDFSQIASRHARTRTRTR